MKAEVPITALVIVGVAVALTSLTALVVIDMGFVGAGVLSASATITEQNGVVVASVTVLRGSLKGLAMMYTAPDGSTWYAKPLYCLGNASLGPTSIELLDPKGPGAGVTCAFQLWFPSGGEYRFVLIGSGERGLAKIAEGLLSVAVPNEYAGQLPAGSVISSRGGPSVNPKGNSYNYTTSSIYWKGGYLVVEVEWGYSSSTCLADGLYVSLFAPSSSGTPVAPSDEGLRILPFGGADYVPAGRGPQIFVQLNPYDGGKYDGSIEVAVLNATSGIGIVAPTRFNPSKAWPTDSVWSTYILYDSSNNSLRVVWRIPGLLAVSYSYNLTRLGFAPPPPGRYGVVVGVANGGCVADWRVYGYTIASS